MRITINYEPDNRLLNEETFTCMDCPFGEEDVYTNELWCFLKPLEENGKCTGCMNEECPICMIEDDEEK